MKEKLRRRAFPLYAGAQVTYRLFTGYRNIRGWRHRSGLQPLWNLSQPPVDGEVPFFILGSGASVNEYGAREWRAIGNGVSVGLNYWVFHEFVPSILMFELCGLQDAFFRALATREREYASTLLLIRGNYLAGDRYYDIERAVDLIPASLRGRTYLSWDFPVPGLDRTEFRRSIQILDRLHLYHPATRLFLVPQSKASLGYAVNYAIRRGAKQVVLCGVDLNDTRYFFQAERRYLDTIGVADFDTGQRGFVHKTNDPAVAPLTISDALDLTEEIVCRPRGVRISVGSTRSALYPRFPYYFADRAEGRFTRPDRAAAHTDS